MASGTFYFDLGSPYAYLTAERIGQVLPEALCWRPISLGAVFKATGRGSWALAGPQSRDDGIAEVERRAAAYGLPALRWPERWPTNYLTAMRAATFAFMVGRGCEFTLVAFRRAFQQGHDLGVLEEVLAAAAAAGLDPEAVERAVRDPEVKLGLRSATDAALALGVFGVPTIVLDGELFWGDDRLEDVGRRLTDPASA